MLMWFWGMWVGMVALLAGYMMGYKEGRNDQKEILIKLRKSIANQQ